MRSTADGAGISLLILLLLLCPVRLQAQDIDMHGRLFDRVSGEGIAHASVYINGTTIGTTTDLEGNFHLDKGKPPFELVISHLAYELKVITIHGPGHPAYSVPIALDKKRIALPGLDVSATNTRGHCMELFNKFFLGVNFEEVDARIINDSVLTFYNIEGNTFNAKANAPLLVSLPKTGYLLSVDLIKFKLGYLEDSLTLHSSILGYFHYDPLEFEKRRQQKLVVRARNEVYYNSRTHFLKSLYQDQLRQEGYILKPVLPQGDSLPAGNLPFSKSYTRDSSGNDLLVLKDFISRNFYLSYYCNNWNQPINMDYNPYRWEDVFFSYLQFRGDSICIYPTGRVPDNSILIGGEIGEKGVSHSLPGDFIPGMR